jgi:hypothetical protein
MAGSLAISVDDVRPTGCEAEPGSSGCQPALRFVGHTAAGRPRKEAAAVSAAVGLARRATAFDQAARLLVAVCAARTAVVDRA